jgi:hypothetical protein
MNARARLGNEGGEKEMRGIRLIRWLAVGVTVALTGCTCGAPEDCDNTYVTFETPNDGATVSSPLDVRVTVADRGGNPVELSNATIYTRLSSATEYSTGTQGTIETGRATFSSVALPAGDNLIKVSVQKANSTCAAVPKVIAVTVGDVSAPPEVTAFTFEGDSNNDGILNSAELPANPASVNAVITASRAQGCTLTMRYTGNTAVGTRTIDAATVTVSMPATGLAGLVDGTYPLFADITCPDGRKNDPTGNPVAQRTLIIDRTAPSCAFLSPSKMVYGPNDDDDTATTGYQLRTLGQAGTGAAQMEIKLNGGASAQTTGPQSASGGSLSRDFVIPSTGTTFYTLVLEVVDAAGNLCTVAKQVTADFEAPTFTISQPTVGNQTSYNLPVTIAVTNGDGATVTVTTTPSGGSPQSVCGGVVANNTFTCNGSFVAGAQTVTVTVTDAAGNSTTQMVSISVTAPGCAFAFTTPSTNPALLSPANDLQPTVNDLQYQFTASSSTAGCGNKAVKLFRNGTELTALAGSTNASGVFQSGTVTEPDSGGTTVSYRAEINDGAGNLTSATVGIQVLLSIPNIVTPANNTNLHAGRDLDPATAGVQAQLTYTPAAPTGYSTTICSSVQFNGGAACPDGKGGFVLATNVAANTTSFSFPDGSYDLRAVFVHAAGTSPPLSDQNLKVHVNVESVRPQVTAFTYQGNANSDGHLNAAEQASGDPVAILTITGANGGTVVVRRTDTSAIVSGSPVTITGGTVNVTLAGLNAASSTFEAPAFNLVAEVTSALGSQNVTTSPPPTGLTLNAAAFSTIRIDRVAPQCAILEPAKAQLGVADDADAAASFQVRVQGSTSADVGTNGVTLELVPQAGTAQTQQVTPSSGNAGHNFTPVAQTGEVDYTAACQARDQSGNVGTRATRAVRVDLAPPTCSIVTPNVASSPYTTSYVIATQVNITGGDGLKARLYSTPTAGAERLLGDADVVSGQASSSFVYLSGQQTVRAEVTDAAGNSCSGAGSTVVITVSAPGCSIQFNKPATHPNYLNASDDTAPGSATTLEYTLTGVTNCPTQSISIFVNNNLVGSPTTDASGNFSQAVSGIAEGAVTFRGDMNVGTPTSNTWSPTVDLSVPDIVSTTPLTNPTGSTLHFVAAGNRFLVPPADPTYVADNDPGTPNAQATIGVRVTGAPGGSASVLIGTTVVGGPIPVVTADETANVPVELTHGSSPTLTIRVTDAAGNNRDRTVAAQVDVVAPAVPGNITCALTPGKEREAKVTLSWDPSYDDGSTTSSGPVQYDVRWTNTLVAPTGLANADEFFSSMRTYQDAAAVAWSGSRISREVSVPTFNAYFCFVRAYDEQGNYSALGATNAADRVDNFWTRATFSNPHPAAAGAQLFGRSISANGSFNNDAIDDFVVGYQQSGSGSDPERVYIYYGNTSAATFAAQTPQVVTAPDSVVGTFGFDVSMGNVGDATTGDNKADLLVGAPRANTSAGRAYLFFGSTTSATLDTSGTNVVVFAGNAGSALGRATQIIGDINGDGLSEILLTASSSDGSRGRVYLFLGRSRSAWMTLANSAPIPMTAADREFLGPTPLVSTTVNFGRPRTGFTSIGSDFTIPSPHTDRNRLYIFGGPEVMAGTGGAANAFLTGIEPTVANQALQTLSLPATTPSFNEGFGTSAQSSSNLIGNANVDLVVGQPSLGRIHIFGDRSVSRQFTATATTVIQGPGVTTQGFGIDVQAGAFSTTGGADLFVGEGFGTSLWFLQNKETAGTEFDTTPGVSGFFHSKVVGTRLGYGLAAGDFTGDGRRDIAAADGNDGTGKVFVWH